MSSRLRQLDPERRNPRKPGRRLPPRFDAMVRQIVVDDAGTVFAAAGPKLFVSDDEGDSWRRLADGLPAVHALAVA